MKLLGWKTLAWNSLLSLTTIAVGLSIAPKAFAALHVGDTGREVRRLQRALGISDDGIYGSQTESAVIRYQQNCGLAVDGVAGTATLDSIAAGNCIANGGFVPLQPGDGFVPLQPGTSTGPYVVVVPGGSGDRLAAVQQVVPGASRDNTDDLRGAFINAGGYGTRSEARRVSNRLRDKGLPARVDFRP
jgi:peptidoglycan hydrolase-like protein with peptidoglycan-binding domain